MLAIIWFPIWVAFFGTILAAFVLWVVYRLLIVRPRRIKAERDAKVIVIRHSADCLAGPLHLGARGDYTPPKRIRREGGRKEKKSWVWDRRERRGKGRRSGKERRRPVQVVGQFLSDAVRIAVCGIATGRPPMADPGIPSAPMGNDYSSGMSRKTTASSPERRKARRQAQEAEAARRELIG